MYFIAVIFPSPESNLGFRIVFNYHVSLLSYNLRVPQFFSSFMTLQFLKGIGQVFVLFCFAFIECPST